MKKAPVLKTGSSSLKSPKAIRDKGAVSSLILRVGIAVRITPLYSRHYGCDYIFLKYFITSVAHSESELATALSHASPSSDFVIAMLINGGCSRLSGKLYRRIITEASL